MAIRVLHCDDALVVVDKPAGILVTSAPGRRGSSIVDLLRRQIGGPVHAVHRLDEDVTGVMVFARTDESRASFETMFRAHRPTRRYLALVCRVPSPPAGRIESRLREDDDGVVRSVASGSGQTAVTEYRTLERRGRFALLGCQLQTGRRNQIRAHMYDIGCPIAGDRKYGYRRRPGDPAFSRPMLHATELGFSHPVTGERLSFVVAAPEQELREPT